MTNLEKFESLFRPATFYHTNGSKSPGKQFLGLDASDIYELLDKPSGNARGVIIKFAMKGRGVISDLQYNLIKRYLKVDPIASITVERYLPGTVVDMTQPTSPSSYFDQVDASIQVKEWKVRGADNQSAVEALFEIAREAILALNRVGNGETELAKELALEVKLILPNQRKIRLNK